MEGLINKSYQCICLETFKSIIIIIKWNANTEVTLKLQIKWSSLLEVSHNQVRHQDIELGGIQIGQRMGGSTLLHSNCSEAKPGHRYTNLTLT